MPFDVEPKGAIGGALEERLADRRVAHFSGVHRLVSAVRYRLGELAEALGDVVPAADLALVGHDSNRVGREERCNCCGIAAATGATAQARDVPEHFRSGTRYHAPGPDGLPPGV
ncbi:hypothetical protein ACQUSR_28475 [Streptomyces sp. P1-3]|uniref:hypothetical protein n=1 Tax=Streptomyces sp. P1-3 TaxID=3421658 RepID=UPI003D364C8B